MVDKKTLGNDIDQLKLLETVTKAYGEIAALRMQHTRDSVLAVRTFLEEIFEIFYEVRFAFIQKWANSHPTNITFLAHNGKQVAVLLSSNSGLYGEIISKTFNLFLEEAKSGRSEVTIIGRSGLAMFTSALPNVPYTYFELQDYNVTSAELTPIIRHIVKYDEIHMYYGRFQNVLVQEPIAVTISSKIELSEEEKKGKLTHKYLFEPTLEDILVFFENEIFSSVFQQSINESSLSKLASRISAMNLASERIETERIKLNISKLELGHKIADRKQRNTIPALLLQFS